MKLLKWKAVVSEGEEMESKITRRTFLKILGGGAISLSGLPLLTRRGEAASSEGKGEKERSPESHIVVAEGNDPYAMTLAALAGLGGMEKFVKRGDIVVVKPNMAFNRAPEQAANTNPEVVKAIVESCLEAGAGVVKVFDRTVNPQRMVYDRSGIALAARKAGARVSFIDKRKFQEKQIPQGKSIKSWPIYKEALEADVFINVPIAKQHSLVRLTLGMKNIMGVLGGNRGTLHQEIDQNLADLNTVIPIHLTVMDAYRILIANGPTGGRLEDVKLTGKVIAGTDRVAVDAYATGLFGLKPEDIGYIKAAYEMGLGEMDIAKMKIEVVGS